MSITLNGIAQGYITDKVTELLASFGISNTLVNMGEYRALGSKNNGEDWKIGIRNPDQTWKISQILPMQNMSVATSVDMDIFLIEILKRITFLIRNRGKMIIFIKVLQLKLKLQQLQMVYQLHSLLPIKNFISR